MTHLSGKTALVTGASRGIGRASALALAKAGAQVLVHYGRAASEADASAATQVALSPMSAYAATKGALETLVRHFAFILGERGIRVNAVAPGFVNTDASLVKTEAGRQFALSIQALKRIAQPDDIADVLTFLASNDARWITGQTLYADGGTRL